MLLNKQSNLQIMRRLFIALLTLIAVITVKANAAEGCTSIVNGDFNPNNKQWTIEFTEEINQDSVIESSIYVEDYDGNRIDDITLEISEDRKKVKVIPNKAYLEGETYYLNVTSDVLSQEGKKLSDNYKMEFTIGEYSSGPFKIINAAVVDNQTINIFFSQPIDKNAEIARYYQISSSSDDIIMGSYKTMSVKKIPGFNNAIQLKLKETTLDEGEMYTLYIVPDIKSTYDVYLNNEKGEYVLLEGNVSGVDRIKIEDFRIAGENLIELKLNSYFDEETASDFYNYSVSEIGGETLEITNIYLNSKSKKITIQTSKYIEKNKDYRIMVKNIKDIFRNNTIRPYSKNFNIEKTTQSRLNYNIKTRDDRTIELIFNENLQEELALDLNNYYIQIDKEYLKSKPTKIYFNKSESNKVTLIFDKSFEIGKKYLVGVSKKLIGAYGAQNNKTKIQYFVAINKRHTVLDVKSAKLIGNNKLKLIFTKEISKEKNNVKDNFRLEVMESGNRKTIIGCDDVKYIDDKTLILTFEGMEENEEYSLIFDYIVDYFGEKVDFNNFIINIDNMEEI